MQLYARIFDLIDRALLRIVGVDILILVLVALCAAGGWKLGEILFPSRPSGQDRK